MAQDAHVERRDWMVRTQLVTRDISDERVLRAMRIVPRHEFVGDRLRHQAEEDRPLSIGHGATISQPYIVALMAQLAQVRPGARVLDVGSGSGYQAAVLAELGAEVYGIEIVAALAKQGRRNLRRAGYSVDLVVGDGGRGRPEHAPFEAIVVAAAAREVPPALLDQLALGGRLIAPIGEPWSSQTLMVLTRTEGGFDRVENIGVRFVPLVSPAQG